MAAESTTGSGARVLRSSFRCYKRQTREYSSRQDIRLPNCPLRISSRFYAHQVGVQTIVQRIQVTKLDCCGGDRGNGTPLGYSGFCICSVGGSWRSVYLNGQKGLKWCMGHSRSYIKTSTRMRIVPLASRYLYEYPCFTYRHHHHHQQPAHVPSSFCSKFNN